MATKKEQLKKLIAEANGIVERSNNAVKHIKPVDTRNVVLSSAPFAAKAKRTLVK